MPLIVIILSLMPLDLLATNVVKQRGCRVKLNRVIGQVGDTYIFMTTSQAKFPVRILKHASSSSLAKVPKAVCGIDVVGSRLMHQRQKLMSSLPKSFKQSLRDRTFASQDPVATSEESQHSLAQNPYQKFVAANQQVDALKDQQVDTFCTRINHRPHTGLEMIYLAERLQIIGRTQQTRYNSQDIIAVLINACQQSQAP